MKKIVNGIECYLVENSYYKKSKYNYECKYKVLFYNDYYDSYDLLYYCNNKRQFTIKRIKEELIYK